MGNLTTTSTPAPNRLTEILDESLTQQNVKELDDVQSALAYRKKLTDKVDQVDALMVGWTEEIRAALVSKEDEIEEEAVPVRRPSVHSGEPRSHNRVRNGKPTHTSRIVDILKKQPDMRMKTTKLLAECSKQKIPNPESPLYSLRTRKRISRTLGPDGEIQYLGDPK